MIDSSSTGYIQLSTSIPIEGANVLKFQHRFIPSTALSYQDVYVNNGITIRGSWFADGGDLLLSTDIRERRYLCTLGAVR